jgi:glycosyltransferase involved in cell wall biosynthesis
LDTVDTAPRPQVTVIVPNLNGAEFLPHALASLAAQECPALEVIAVDGGSTDGSIEILRDWSGRHPIRWVSERDTGQAAAINRGLAMARGEVVSWLNGDDLLLPRTARIAAERFAADPSLDFLWGFCLVIDADGRSRYIQNPFVRTDLADLRRHRNFVPQPGSFFRKSVVERFGRLDESYRFMFDYEFFLRLAGSAKALFVPEVLACFRLHPSSKTGRSHREFLKEEWRAFRAHGGSILSPFTLDLLRFRLVSRPLDRIKGPLRRALWAAMRLPGGSRIRP